MNIYEAFQKSFEKRLYCRPVNRGTQRPSGFAHKVEQAGVGFYCGLFGPDVTTNGELHLEDQNNRDAGFGYCVTINDVMFGEWETLTEAELMTEAEQLVTNEFNMETLDKDSQEHRVLTGMQGCKCNKCDFERYCE